MVNQSVTQIRYVLDQMWDGGEFILRCSLETEFYLILETGKDFFGAGFFSPDLCL